MKNALVYAVNGNQRYVDCMVNSINSFYANNPQELLDTIQVFVITDQDSLDTEGLDERASVTLINELSYDYSKLPLSDALRQRFSTLMFARFELFKNPIFRDFDNVLYLDCDTEVRQGISELFVKRKKPEINVVSDIVDQFNRLGVFSYHKIYVNSGFILLTPNMFSSETLNNMFDKLTKEYDQFIAAQHPDQNILNEMLNDVRFYKYVKLLDARYNMLTGEDKCTLASAIIRHFTRSHGLFNFSFFQAQKKQRQISLDELNLLIMDSNEIAGDNGEYLYRRIQELYPQVKMTFLIDDKNQDEKRLLEDNFNIIHSSEIEKVDDAFRNATWILWSKGYWEKLRGYKEKTIFLQHGTLNSINDSTWLLLSMSETSRYILCSSSEEADLSYLYSQGIYTPIIIGLPRQDTLLIKSQSSTKDKKQIFISPHWRRGRLHRSEINFLISNYKRNIEKLLNSERLKQLNDSGVDIVFRPHHAFTKYATAFKVPPYVKLDTQTAFQDILVQSDLLITDFSSNSFEMAYMNKPSIIWIPEGVDEIKKDYPQYHPENISKYKHMFYCDTQDQVFDSIQKLLNTPKNEFKFSNQLFKYVDTDNTKRLVEWMLEHAEGNVK